MAGRALTLGTLTVLSTLACATAGPSGPDLAFEEILGLWEMGDPQNGFVTGRVTFLEEHQVLVQCGTVAPVSPSDTPRDVTRRNRGWAFRGCTGEVVVQRDAEGRIQARSDASSSRATVGRSCTRVQRVQGREQCVEYSDNIRNVSSPTGDQPIGFWRPGEGPGGVRPF